MGKLSNVLRRQPASTANDVARGVEARLDAGRATLATAEAALDAARIAYDTSLGSGRDAALAARRSRDEAEVDVDVARASVTSLETELAIARAQAREAETALLVRHAREKAQHFEALVRRELPLLAIGARSLARAWAESEIAREDANRAIGTGTDHLPPSESFRIPEASSREVIEDSIVELWVHPVTQVPLSDDQIERIRERGGRYFLRRRSGLSGATNVEIELGPKMRFRKIVTIPPASTRETTLLISALNIPGITVDSPAGWTSPDYLTPNTVLKRLSELEDASSFSKSDPRVPTTKLIRCVSASSAA